MQLIADREPSVEAWTELASASPSATVYQTPTWASVIQETFGYVCCTRLFEFSDGTRVLFPCEFIGRRRGVFPEYRSVPSGYGGFVGNRSLSAGHFQLLWRRVVRLCGVAGTVIVRSNPMLEQPMDVASVPWYVRQTRMRDFTHVLDLTEGFDLLWKSRFHVKVRNQYRKGIREGVTVRTDNSPEGVRRFFALYQQTSRDWPSREQKPVQLFHKMVAEGGCQVRIWLAEQKESVTIGGAVAWYFGPFVHVWATARDEQYSRLRQMEVLYTEIIKHACDQGFAVLDFGSSLGLPSVQAFKEQFGPRKVDYDVVQLEGRVVHAFRTLAKRFAGG